jgi:hypothetical protein
MTRSGILMFGWSATDDGNKGEILNDNDVINRIEVNVTKLGGCEIDLPRCVPATDGFHDASRLN